MPPATSLAALMQSPAYSDSTVIANGKTLPDITLGSFGSSFRSDEEEEAAAAAQGAGGARAGPSRANRLQSPSSSDVPSFSTPSPQHPPASALLSLSPPTTVRRTSSHSALPDTAPGSQAPRRSRILRKSSVSSASDSDFESTLDARYGNTDDEDENVLSALSINVSPAKKGGMAGSRGPSKRSGRHSVAAGTGPMTLREQEQELDSVKKDNFNLQLENHFLKERLANMAPDHIEAALKENVKLKLEILNLSKEMKKLKKLLLQQDRDLAEAARNGDGKGGKAASDARELERLYREEKERRKAAESEYKRLEEELASGASAGAAGEDVAQLRDRLEDTEASEQVWRNRCETLEEELENAKAANEDHAEEMERVRDAADRAQEELEKLQAQHADVSRGLGDSIGVGKGREARLQQKVADLEQANASLQAELEELRKAGGGADVEELQDRFDELRDKLAAVQLDLDRRDQEIDELNSELDGRVREHEKELGQVEAGWRDEVLEVRAQVDEIREELEGREQDVKDLREALLEREDELAYANDRVAELQSVQNETHDRLEETLKNIERDNDDKDADLIAANREVEELGQRVYELEEAVEELRARESDLNADLRSADDAFENAKTHYENLVAALKEARKKLQDEKEDVVGLLKDEEAKRAAERERFQRDKADEAARQRRALADKDQLLARLQSELDAARDRVSLRDKDLASVQTALRGLEDDRKKLGDEHTSDRFSLELEIERVKRDLEQCEDELDRAKADLHDRDVEYGQLLERQRELESLIASERQSRLNMSDKLDEAAKTAKKYEREATLLRERIEELEPLLTETQQERFQLQRQSEQQRQERSELLLRVFKDVNRFLGTDDHATPANFSVFRDTLLSRLRAINGVRSDFEKRIKDTEGSVEQRMNALKKQLEQKWRALDNFEAAVKKLEITRTQWRSKYAIKDGELEAAKARIAELSQQLSGAKASSSTESSTHVRGLTERAAAAEKRAGNATNQLSLLESRIAELQTKAAQAEAKWEARVKEYENRLRIAGEKIKTEKQGGKERAAQLEGQVRDLEKQVEQARRRNQRAEGVVATAAHLLPQSPESSL
ncbi:hypothetical protein EHS25_002444 [Saitozyma podzolica]|uniref:Centrosomin N-terminal motif 1 domain-containing protein n=1 Tax=Saitozyma podzolica TaxID=1890683 RepID=A0A427YE47_9TREE|nr:hypothetical protein EHS25_002444 [Saitozyma podzolica]